MLFQLKPGDPITVQRGRVRRPEFRWEKAMVVWPLVVLGEEVYPQPLITFGSSVGHGMSVVGRLKGFMSTWIWGCLKFRDTQNTPPKCLILLDPSWWARKWTHTVSLHVFYTYTCPNICSHWVRWIWCNIFSIQFAQIWGGWHRLWNPWFLDKKRPRGDDLDDVSDLFVEQKTNFKSLLLGIVVFFPQYECYS